MYNNNKQASWVRCILFMIAMGLYSSALSNNNSNYQFLNNKTETSFRFEMVDNLIVIPVQVNELELDLILDTGMRSIVLFGRRFQHKLNILNDVTVRLSGYGKRKNRPGKLSLGNDIIIEDVKGSNVSIVVMPDPDLFKNAGMYKVDGIIGYEIFSRFIVKIDYPNRTITLYEPYIQPDWSDFSTVPLTVQDTKPYITASIINENGDVETGHYHLDTGSAQDILLFMNENKNTAPQLADRTFVGTGIGGKIHGYKSKELIFKLAPGVERQLQPKYIKRVFSDRELQNADGSIGSGFLKDMVIVLDYIHMTFHVERMPAHQLPINYPSLVKVDI